MKKIKLTQNKYALIDESDYQLVSQYKWYFNKGYAASHDKDNNHKMIYMHRIVNKTPGNLQTDHINGNKLDNCRQNLRTVTRQQNAFNIGKLKTNTSGYKGVYFRPLRKTRQWMAQITLNNKSICLGYFDNPEIAFKEYCLKAKEIYGSYAGGLSNG